MLIKSLRSVFNFVIEAIQLPFVLLFKMAIRLRMASVARILSKYCAFTRPIAAEYISLAIDNKDRAQLKFFIDSEIYKNTYQTYNSVVAENRPDVSLAAFKNDFVTLEMLATASRAGNIDHRYVSGSMILNSVIWFSSAPIEQVIQALKNLLQLGLNLNDDDYMDETTLICALRNKKYAIVEFLLDNGATQPNVIDFEFTDSPDSKQCFAKLAAKGFQIRVTNKNMELSAAQTKLLSTHQAPTAHDLRNLQPQNISHLLRATYFVYTKLINKIDGHIKELISQALPRDAWQNILSYLWDNTEFHAKIKSRLYDGPNLLHKAIVMQDIPKIKDIVRLYPESVNASNNQGFTPLYYAHNVGSNQIKQLLIENGAEIASAEPSNDKAESLKQKYNNMWVLKRA